MRLRPYTWTRVPYADKGDGAWDGVIPEPAQKEMREAKGKVHEMGAKPWWCAAPPWPQLLDTSACGSHPVNLKGM